MGAPSGKSVGAGVPEPAWVPSSAQPRSSSLGLLSPRRLGTADKGNWSSHSWLCLTYTPVQCIGCCKHRGNGRFPAPASPSPSQGSVGPDPVHSLRAAGQGWPLAPCWESRPEKAAAARAQVQPGSTLAVFCFLALRWELFSQGKPF